ncbi:unnamed protein product, partial [Aphanomyces euteiches]
ACTTRLCALHWVRRLSTENPAAISRVLSRHSTHTSCVQQWHDQGVRKWCKRCTQLARKRSHHTTRCLHHRCVQTRQQLGSHACL